MQIHPHIKHHFEKVSPLLPSRLIALLTILSSLIYVSISFARHYLLQSGIYDLGLFNQWTYLVSIGKAWAPSSLTNFSKPALGDHFSLLLYPFAWLQNIFPSSYSLILWQSLGVSLLLLAFIIQLPWYTRRDRRISIFVSIALILNPYIVNSVLNDFHPEIAASFFGLTALSLARRGKLILSLTSLAIFLASKEAMIVFGLGYAVYTFTVNRKLLSVASFFLSTSYFLIANHFVSPYLNYAQARYGQFGSSFLDVVFSPIEKPILFLSTVFSIETLTYILPFALCFIFLLNSSGIPALFAVLPVLIANILSASSVMRDPIYQYQLPLIIFLMQAVLDSLNAGGYDRVLLSGKSKTLLFILVSLITTVLLTQASAYFTRYFRFMDYSRDVLSVELQLSSPQLKVWSHPAIATHFSRRETLSTVTIDLEKNTYDYIVFPLPSPSTDPKSILTKLRNKLFGYGESDEFFESETLKDTASSLGYDCVNSKHKKIVTCFK